MKQIIGNKPLEYTIDKQFITVTSKEANRTAEPRQETIKVQGKVVDENGVPVPGVNIKIHGTKQGTMTDLDGRYTVKVKPDDVLDFSFIGYKTEQIPVKGKTTVNLSLEPSSKNLDEVTVVAFGSQKKESVVSAITTIRPGELKTSSSDLTSSFAGKIPGMIAWQTGGLPGALTEDEMNTKFRKFLFYPLNYRALCNNYRYNFLFLFTINLNFTTFAIVWKNIRFMYVVSLHSSLAPTPTP
nr:carboxypeptidase-like regulatory domain-containing protein [Bacteroides acidifaciens]